MRQDFFFGSLGISVVKDRCWGVLRAIARKTPQHTLTGTENPIELFHWFRTYSGD